MTLRTGMTDLVAEVRSLTGAGTATWSDEEVQRFLDRRREDYYGEPIRGVARQLPGSVTYQAFYAPFPLESGTAAFVLTDALGGTVAAARYSLEADTGLVTLTAGTASSELFLTGRRHDPWAAGADLLEAWAGSRSVDGWALTQDQQTLSRAERITSMLEAAKRLRARARPRVARLRRRDG